MKMRADAFNRDIREEGFSWRNIGIGALIIVAITALVGIVIWIKNTFGDPPMSKEDKQRKRILESIVVLDSDMTISKSQTKQRALNLDTALRGMGHDRMLIAKQFINTAWWPYLSGKVSVPPGGGTSDNVKAIAGFFSGDIVNNTALTLKGALQKAKLSDAVHGTHILLNKYDLEQIAKDFGVRKTKGINWLGLTALSTKDWFTLREWIGYEQDKDLQDSLEMLYAPTRILV